MCGRLNVSDSPLSEWVSELLGIRYQARRNDDFRPTEQAAVVVSQPEIRQLDLSWGIKPDWAKRILINAQAETVAQKPTFKRAFHHQRCLIPCSGWYEWRIEGDGRKQKYLFTGLSTEPLLMAAIWYPQGTGGQFVTLTTMANAACRDYHHRMPLLVPPDAARQWLRASPEAASELLVADEARTFQVSAA